MAKDDTKNAGENAGENKSNTGLPAESLERGADASQFVDNPDKPDETTVAQIERLPDESE